MQIGNNKITVCHAVEEFVVKYQLCKQFPIATNETSITGDIVIVLYSLLIISLLYGTPTSTFVYN